MRAGMLQGLDKRLVVHASDAAERYWDLQWLQGDSRRGFSTVRSLDQATRCGFVD
jgi:hypothetical protein